MPIHKCPTCGQTKVTHTQKVIDGLRDFADAKKAGKDHPFGYDAAEEAAVALEDLRMALSIAAGRLREEDDNVTLAYVNAVFNKGSQPVKSIPELLESLRGASEVAFDDDVGLFMKQEDCKLAADEIERLREVVRGVRIMANAGAFKAHEGEPWLTNVQAVDLEG